MANMFGNLKERLTLVGKLFTENKVTNAVSGFEENSINLNAGAQVLSHYQNQWAQLHEISEQNARCATEIAENIMTMHEKICQDYKNVCEMTNILSAGTQTLSKSVETCVKQLETLTESFETVESGLLQLENLIENLEHQEKELEHRFQFALYKERKLANLEALRTSLAAKHAQSLIEHELRQKEILQERQQAFQEAFQTDLQIYKKEGTIPKIEKKPETHAEGLEEIQLEYDSKDLDQFLNQ